MCNSASVMNASQKYSKATPAKYETLSRPGFEPGSHHILFQGPTD